MRNKKSIAIVSKENGNNSTIYSLSLASGLLLVFCATHQNSLASETLPNDSQPAKARSELRKLGNSVKLETNESGDTRRVALLGNRLVERGLPHLKDLPGLKVLSLYSTHETLDAQLVELANLSSVQEIWFNGSTVTDDGLAHIGELTHLRVLQLSGTKVSNAGMRHLVSIKTLESVDLAGTEITDCGVAKLGKLPNLRSLVLPERITDKGVASLTGLRNLETLHIYTTPRSKNITDAALKSLTKNRKLNTLYINGSQITDKGLEHLTKIPTLTQARLLFSQVSENGIAELRKKRPGLKLETSVSGGSFP